MQDPIEQRPGASGRRWAERHRAARVRRHGEESAPSRWEQAIAAGMVGEEIVGNALTALAQEINLGVLHDLALPGNEANIDHLVIGPAGVTVVDAKAWKGRVWIGRTTIRQGRHSRHRSLVGLNEQVERVKVALASAGHPEVPVSGLVCLVNENAGVPRDCLKWVQGVGVGTIPNVRRHVARDGDIQLSGIRAIHRGLAGEFVVSGGEFVPSLGPPGTFEPARAEPDLIDKLIAEINHDQGRRHRRSRRVRRLPALLGTVAALLVGTASLASLEGPARVTRAELDRSLPELREIARKRADGRVGRPSVRTSPQRFVVRFRRGKRCQVSITVDRGSRERSVSAKRCRARR